MLLRTLGIDFEEVRIPLDTPEFSRQIRAFSHAARVPVLLDGRTTIWDSLAICEYVAEAVPLGTAWPAERAKRAWARSVCAEMHSGFGALRASMPMNCRRHIPGFVPSPAARADIDRVVEIWTACRSAHHSDGQWLFGDFSVADAMYAPVVMRFATYDVSLPESAAEYSRHVRNCEPMRAWVADATAEEEVLPSEEVAWP